MKQIHQSGFSTLEFSITTFTIMAILGFAFSAYQKLENQKMTKLNKIMTQLEEGN